MDASKQQTGKAPYGSFQTFWSFVDSLATKQLPPRIDRSMIDGKSGSDQLGIFMALRAFGLIEGDDQKVKPALVTLVTNTEGRKDQLAQIVREFYRQQLEVSDQNGTEKMLLDSFEEVFDLTGDTRRKAATFFLQAARESGITVSEHFPKVRSGPGSVPGSRTRRTAKRRTTPPAGGIQQTPPAGGTPVGGDEFTVTLRAGGSVTLRVNVGHFALSRDKEDRDFVQGLMDALTSYEEKVSGPSHATEVSAGSTPASQLTDESDPG